jgi:hypothetical protein
VAGLRHFRLKGANVEACRCSAADTGTNIVCPLSDNRLGSSVTRKRFGRCFFEYGHGCRPVSARLAASYESACEKAG